MIFEYFFQKNVKNQILFHSLPFDKLVEISWGLKSELRSCFRHIIAKITLISLVKIYFETTIPNLQSDKNVKQL